jgi:hypothetical protein
LSQHTPRYRRSHQRGWRHEQIQHVEEFSAHCWIFGRDRVHALEVSIHEPEAGWARALHLRVAQVFAVAIVHGMSMMRLAFA